jgi:hypothetical protein
MAAALRIRLICWNDNLASEHGRILSDAGFAVNAAAMRNASGIIGHFKAHPVDAVVIDLDRLPSYGREVAIVLRNSKSTRMLPIIFAGGVEDKVARLRTELPDAGFASWDKIKPAIQRAVKSSPVSPVQPTPHMQRWSGSNLVHKLGISAGMTVPVIGDSNELGQLLDPLPDSATLSRRITPNTALALYLVNSLADASSAYEHASAHLPRAASFWIIHPKRTSKQAVDFTQEDIRLLGIEHGFVDYKVCSVSDLLSGLKFTRPKRRKSP